MANQSNHHTNWLLSFGDLLTILLCFFIVIISTSDFSKEQKGSKETVNPSGENVGITFANLEEGKEGDVGFLVNVKAEKIESGFEQVLVEIDRKLEKFINSDGYTKTPLEVISCHSVGKDNKSSSWMIVMNRALQIMRHLNDRGVSKENIEVEVLGPYCNRLKSGDMNIALRIQSVFGEKLNG